MTSRSFITLWIIGVGSVIVWFWGDRIGIPKDAQILASQLGGGLIGYAIRKDTGQSPDSTGGLSPQPQPQPEQST